MPTIVVTMKEGRNEEQRKAIIEGLTREFVKITTIDTDKVQVIIEEVKKGNWGIGGKLI
jgi:4-oxalocrotonate tautomerase